MNYIEAITAFVPVLDQQYQEMSKSAILDTPPAFIQSTDDAKKFKLATISTDGLADYSRAEGFEAGDTDLVWTEYEYKVDRGRSFQVDHQENAEALGLAVASLAGVFNRQKVIPEIDAYRFAKYAQAAGNVLTTTPTKDNALSLIDQARAAMDNAEVPEEGTLLFCSVDFYNMICNSTEIQKQLDVTTVNVTEGGKSITKKIYSYNGMELIKVPQVRFWSSVELVKTGAGGYKPTADAKKLHFLMIHPTAVFQHIKHTVSRVWAPSKALVAGSDGVNPRADAWKIDYRLYHDAFSYTQKSAGIAVCIDTGDATITITTTPADRSSASASSTSTMTVTFSEVVKKIGGEAVTNEDVPKIVKITKDGVAVPFTANVGGGNNVFTLTPTKAFEAGDYIVQVLNGKLVDADGNSVTGAASYITLT